MQRWCGVILAAAVTMTAPLCAQQASGGARTAAKPTSAAGATRAGAAQVGVSQAAAAPAKTPAVPKDVLLAAAREIIGAARYANMITNGLGGTPGARIVDPFPIDADFTVWIGTVAASRKVTELKKDPRVTLLYFNAPMAEYVLLQGKATFVADPALRASHFKTDWNNYYKDQWRGPDYALLRVKVTHVEVLAPRRAINNNPVTWQPPSVDLP